MHCPTFQTNKKGIVLTRNPFRCRLYGRWRRHRPQKEKLQRKKKRKSCRFRPNVSVNSITICYLCFEEFINCIILLTPAGVAYVTETIYDLHNMVKINREDWELVLWFYICFCKSWLLFTASVHLARLTAFKIIKRNSTYGSLSKRLVLERSNIFAKQTRLLCRRCKDNNVRYDTNGHLLRLFAAVLAGGLSMQTQRLSESNPMSLLIRQLSTSQTATALPGANVDQSKRNEKIIPEVVLIKNLSIFMKDSHLCVIEHTINIQ